jgi:hypothetical protein
MSGQDILVSGWEYHDLVLLGLFLLIKIAITILLGIKGNAWAWQKQHYNSVEEFKKRERSWLAAGLVYCLLIIFVIDYAIFVIVSEPPSQYVKCYDCDRIKGPDYTGFDTTVITH